MEWTTVAGKTIPQNLVPDGTEQDAALLMVLCGRGAPPKIQQFGFDGFGDLNEMFKETKVDMRMIEETSAFKAARTIAGKKVHVINHKNKLVYVDMSDVENALTPADIMISLKQDQLDSGDVDAMVHKGLKRGLMSTCT